MKKETHPQWYPDAKVVCDGEVVMTIGSTQPEIRVDIWSGNHPFYTGQQRLVDTEGQVDRFMRRLQRRSEIQESFEEEEEKSNAAALEVTAMGLGTRVENSLATAELEIVGDILSILQTDGDDGLLALPGVGQKALIDIKRFLRSEGLIE